MSLQSCFAADTQVFCQPHGWHVVQHPYGGDERKQRCCSGEGLSRRCCGAERGCAHRILARPCLPQPCHWSQFPGTRKLSGRPANSVPGNFFSTLLLTFGKMHPVASCFITFVGMSLAHNRSAQLIAFVVLFLEGIESAGERHGSDRLWSRHCVHRGKRLFPPPTKAFPWSRFYFDFLPFFP